MPEADHAHEHGDRQQRVGARREEGDLACLGDLIVAGFHDAQNLFLVGPDEYPYVEQHDRTEPGADADDHGLRVEYLATHAQRERGREHLEMSEIRRAREPRHGRTPAEPPEGAWRDVLGDAGAAGATLVAGRIGQGWHLHKIEVIEQADPGNTGQHVDPDDEAAHVERDPHGRYGNDNGEHDAACDDAPY